MRALVTGGAGFIGGHLSDALVCAGHDVTVLDSLDPRVHPADAGPPQGVRFVRGDVASTAALADALAGAPDVIFHEAAMVGLGRGALDAEDYVRTNVIGTVRLMQAAAGLENTPRIVLASSMAIYGEGAYRCPSCDEPRVARRKREDLDAGVWDPLCPPCGTALACVAVTEDHAPAPETVYAVSKLDQERIAMVLARDLGVELVALRYHNVYGARMPHDTPHAGVAALFRSRALKAQAPLVHEDGTQLRDFVHVDDVVAANLLAATAPAALIDREAFHIGSGEPRPIMDLARELAKAADVALTPRLSGTYRAGDARHIVASIEKARRVLHYEPRVLFDEGVRRFLTDPARAAPARVVA